MLNNILNYIEKNKLIFTIIVIFLVIVLIITYKKKYDNISTTNGKTYDNIASFNSVSSNYK